METKQWCDLRGAKPLLNFVFENYRLKETDRKVFRALQSLESQQDGLCKDVVANHRTIARCAKINRNTAGPSLARLESAGLIEYTPGSKDYAQHMASRIRRLSIAELEVRRRQKQPAYKLAAILNRRRIQYGKNQVQPKYRVGITNRLYASDPPVQGKKAVRAEWLAEGCKDGEVLIELDFSAAEPSVISQRLGQEKDGYRIIAEAEEIDRGVVKSFFNSVVYARATATAAATKAGIKSEAGLAFIKQVDALRDELRRPGCKVVRSVTTATGTVITAEPEKKLHKGVLLSYYAQGTIADFVNQAALKIIEQEKAKGWRLAIPCHDALYVIGRPEHEKELVEIMQAETVGSGVTMGLTVNTTAKRPTAPNT